jgi:hypothetical protein
VKRSSGRNSFDLRVGLPVSTFWSSGPRTSAWEKLWQRILLDVLGQDSSANCPTRSHMEFRDEDEIGSDEGSDAQQRRA